MEVLITFFNDSNRTLRVHGGSAKCYDMRLNVVRMNDEQSLTEIKPRQEVYFFYPEQRDKDVIPFVKIWDDTILVQ